MKNTIKYDNLLDSLSELLKYWKDQTLGMDIWVSQSKNIVPL